MRRRECGTRESVLFLHGLGPASGRIARYGTPETDVRLNPAGADAVTAAARIKRGDCRRVNGCVELTTSRLLASRDARASGKKIILLRVAWPYERCPAADITGAMCYARRGLRS